MDELEDERLRLAALRSLDILDTAPEERFDRVVRLAQRLFDVPMASVSLIDEDRHWNKASVGMPAQEFPRSDSFCAETIRRPGPLVVRDLTEDRRFRDFPVVVGPGGARFYAGQPLVAGGQRVGSLCILDDEPRELSESDLDLLRDLASWVEKELSSDEELRQAADVQRRLLPRRPPQLPGYDVAGRCAMARQVGGDFFDWYPVDDAVQLVIGDVMGKGTAAAIIAAGVRAVVRGASRFNDLPEAVTRAAFSLEEDLAETATFVTAFAARLAPADGSLEFVDAGHGLAAVLDPDGGLRRLQTGGLPLGALPGERWESGRTVLAPRETLVAVSDGVLDLFDSPRKALDTLTDLSRRSATAQDLVDQVARLAAREVATDDVTVVAVRRDATS